MSRRKIMMLLSFRMPTKCSIVSVVQLQEMVRSSSAKYSCTLTEYLCGSSSSISSIGSSTYSLYLGELGASDVEDMLCFQIEFVSRLSRLGVWQICHASSTKRGTESSWDIVIPFGPNIETLAEEHGLPLKG